VSVLEALNQSLFVKNLKVSDKIEVLTPGDEMVAKVVPAKEEIIQEVAPVAAAEVEVIGKGKKEEEVVEGEAPAAGAEAKKPVEAAKKEEKK